MAIGFEIALGATHPHNDKTTTLYPLVEEAGDRVAAVV